jgi:hypothetical protein
MPKKWFAPAVTIAACAALLTGGGAAAYAAPTVPAPAVSAPPAAPSAGNTQQGPAGGGPVQFTAYQNDDLPGAAVVLSGAIGDFGTAVSVLPNETVDPEHSSQYKLLLTQGSFRLLAGPLHAQFVQALSQAPYNLSTCSGHATVTGAVPVVADSGTGAYKGIHGTFTLTITGNEVDAKPGCHPFSGTALLAQTIFIAGSGTVTYP